MQIDDDLVEAFKMGGIHIARNGMRGEFESVMHFSDSVVPISDLMGKTSANVLPQSESAGKITEARIQVAKTGVAQDLDTVATTLFQQSSYARCIIVPRRANGRIVGSTSLFIDMSSKQRQLEEMVTSMKQANEDLKTMGQLKDDFLKMISHEVRTPLNGVVGMLQLLESSELNSDQREYVDTMFRSGQRLLRIINSILDFSKLESCVLKFECKPFKLRRLISDAIHTIKSQQDRNFKAQFIIEVDPRLPDILLGDDVRLYQILCNLLNNAAKYIDDGFITTKALKLDDVELHLIVKDESHEPDKPDNPEEEKKDPKKDPKKAAPKTSVTVRFEVQDTGVGIPKDFLDRLFEPFSQAHPTRARIVGGTGLGLAICKKLVDGMGGTIGADSEEGQGSKFWFTVRCGVPRFDTDLSQLKSNYMDDMSTTSQPLPPPSLKVPSPSPLTVPSPLTLPSVSLIPLAPPATASTVPTINISVPITVSSDAVRSCSTTSSIVQTVEAPKACVLLAEDNIINVKVLTKMLENLKIQVDIAEDGQKAVDKFLGNPSRYNAILMDISMPIKDGIQATRDIREWEQKQASKRPAIPIIAVTAHAIAGVDAYYIEQGMNDYIAKPVMMDTLKKVLKTWKVI